MNPIVVEATYENGTLKLDHPLPLEERKRVRITVQADGTLAEQTAGMMGWTGSAELADYFGMSPELEFPDTAGET